MKIEKSGNDSNYELNLGILASISHQCFISLSYDKPTTTSSYYMYSTGSAGYTPPLFGGHSLVVVHW